MDLKDRTVIVTGAGSGIGRALAREFARHGARVICCARRKDQIEETVNLIEREGGKGLPVPADVTQRDQVQKLVGISLERYHSVDILFNNAGLFRSIGGVYEIDPEVWWQDVTVNLYGSLLLIREILPTMLQKNEGIIINMDGGRSPGGTGYACGKAGLMELTRLLAEELKLLGSSVMVFAANPGLVRTEMTRYQATTPAGQKWIPQTKENLDAGRVRQPEEIAQATMKMIRTAHPGLSGTYYSPDTDFSTFGHPVVSA